MKKVNQIKFKVANLDRDMSTCIEFRKDSFFSSFGSYEKWVNQSGENGEIYSAWLKKYQSDNPNGVIHLWKQGEIIGQLEFMLDKNLLRRGYVNLFYLTPELRGSDAGEIMHKYVCDELKGKKCSGARLSVSETNERAISYYTKYGWQYVEPRKEDPTVHIYEIIF